MVPRRADPETREETEDRWSPADNPYAIAVSHSWWVLRALLLFASQARSSEGPDQQIYARQIFGQLRLLGLCARMQAKELDRLEISADQQEALSDAIARFNAATPGAKDARDILEHFDEYARGEGKLQRGAIRDLELGVNEAAALYWGGGYNLATEQVTEGPYVIDVPAAVEASEALHLAIYAAGKAIDAHRQAAARPSAQEPDSS